MRSNNKGVIMDNGVNDSGATYRDVLKKASIGGGVTGIIGITAGLIGTFLNYKLEKKLIEKDSAPKETN